MDTQQERLRVAILGGGLAGAFLLRGLRKHEHLNVHIFEARPKFREEGAGIALSCNATSALKGTDPEIISCLDRAGAVKPQDTIQFIGQGPDAGHMLKRINRPDGMDTSVGVLTCARQPLLTELLKDFPESRMHSGKRLTFVDDSAVTFGGGRYRLTFEDGTSDEFDVVLGSDGIYGPSRAYVLGEDQLDVGPVACGICIAPILVPFEAVDDSLRRLLHKKGEQEQLGWCGKGGYMLADLHNGGNTVQLIGVVHNQDIIGKAETWRRDISHAEFRNRFKDYVEPVSKGAVEAICANSSDPITLYCANHHRRTQTYVKGRVCLLGDAAHATSPSMASGGGMSAEDACILSALMGVATSKEDVSAAFMAYETLRKPRCHKIIDCSFETGNVQCGSRGLDPTALDEYFVHAWDDIQLWRADEEVPRALNLYRELRNQSKY